MKLLKSLVVVVSLMTPWFASADIIDFIDNGRTTIDKSDENSWLEWLDLSETIARTYNDVSSDLSDGTLNLIAADDALKMGWRYASIDEVVAMFDSFFTATISNDAFVIVSQDEADAFVELFGETMAPGNQTPIGSMGVTGSEVTSGSGSRQMANLLAFLPAAITTDSVVDSFARGDAGHWLVRDIQNVSEPSALVLFLAGLALVTRKRRD